MSADGGGAQGLEETKTFFQSDRTTYMCVLYFASPFHSVRVVSLVDRPFHSDVSHVDSPFLSIVSHVNSPFHSVVDSPFHSVVSHVDRNTSST